MRDAVRKHGSPEPEFQSTGFFTATFRPLTDTTGGDDQTTMTGTKSALSRHQVQLLEFATEPRSLVELMELVGRRDRTKFRTKFLQPLLDAHLMEMTVPDKPRSRSQRYVTTIAGGELARKASMDQ